MKKVQVKQGGWTLVELMFVLVIAAGALHWLMTYVSEESDLSNRQAAVGHIRKVADASNNLLKANYSAYLAAASPTLTIAASDIATQLPSGFNMVNNYGQSYSLRLNKVSSTRLEAVLLTTGGDTLSNGEVRKIAQALGSEGGGYIASGAPSQLVGGYGGYSRPIADFGGATPGAGHFAVALFYKDIADANSDLLHRNFEANAELNTMNTPINMQARATEKTSDALCIVGDTSTYGRISADSTGKPLACISGVWTSAGDTHWREPVATYAALPATGNAVSDVRMVSNLARAFTWNGSAWVALAVDQNGNMTVPGTVRNGKNFLADVSAEGTSCPEIGLQSRDGAGLPLSCQSTSKGIVWARAVLSEYVLVSGNDPGCAGAGQPGAFYTAYSYAQCPAGYHALGVGYLQGSYCGTGTTNGVSGITPYANAGAVWPQDNFSYTYVVQVACGK